MHPPARLIAFVFILALSASCGSDDDGGGGSGAPTSPLVGTWMSDCVAATGSYADAGWARITSAYEATSFNSSTTFYSDSICNEPVSKQTLVGTYTVGMTVANGASKLDLLLQDWLFTPLTEARAKENNDATLCGLSTWQSAKDVSVLGRTCRSSKYPPAGAVNKDVFQLAGDVLTMGDGSMRDSEGYPSKLGATPLERQ